MSEGGEARNHEAEVEAVALVLHYENFVDGRERTDEEKAERVIAALDAVRRSPKVEKTDRERAAERWNRMAGHVRSPQGEDHEAAIDYHLLPDALPLAQCDVCRRKSWALDGVGATCSMPQPSGGPCGGEMCGRVDGLVAMIRHKAARSPERDTEKLVKAIVARIRKGAPCDSDARHLIFEAIADAIEREFQVLAGESSTTEE